MKQIEQKDLQIILMFQTDIYWLLYKNFGFDNNLGCNSIDIKTFKPDFSATNKLDTSAIGARLSTPHLFFWWFKSVSFYFEEGGCKNDKNKCE